MQKPDWKFWCEMPNVQLWQACLLSLDVDPDGTNPDNIAQDTCLIGNKDVQSDDVPDPITNKLFGQLLRLLISNIGDPQYFTACAINHNSPFRHSVRLDEFAAWCLRTREIGIPMQLVSIAMPLIAQRSIAERRAAGSYTLHEAAVAVSGGEVEHEFELEEKLIRAAKGGALKVFGPNKNANYLLPGDTGINVHYAEAFWSDLNAWLRTNEPIVAKHFEFCGPQSNAVADSSSVIAYSDAEITAPVESKMKSGDSTTSNWIMLIQTEAARRWLSLKNSGASPTKHSMKDDLAKWCRDNHVCTTTKINPNADYIYRHVLRKWSPPSD